MAEEPTLLRKKRARSKYPLHWVIIPLTIVAAGLWGAWVLFRPPPQGGPFVLPGYITSASTFEQECTHFYDKAANHVAAEEKFRQAAESMANHDYAHAAALLETAAKEFAIPAVFNDLGVLYAKLGDRSRTLNAFREALAHDSGYVPARQNLERLKGLNLSAAVYPVTREIEPNGTLPLANLISLDQPVEGEIAENLNDVDCYRVNASPPPRDLMQIEVSNGSKTLALSLSLFDDNMLPLPSDQEPREPGASLTGHLSPPPNSTVYLKIWGARGTAGKYTLLVRMLKAFDAHEPNDQIFNATKIVPGEPIQANIMDAQDTDFYSFVSPRTGKLSIEILNRSSTLIPALTTFSPDKRTSGFGPDVTKPGAGLEHTIEVLEDQVYYVQVWSQRNTAGNYTLTIR
ncbi:MAG: hypothetical protein LAQ69_35170 [Acidobacteriia bacterium]|nr:hypothetical protein [Terriglobia bacterium]